MTDVETQSSNNKTSITAQSDYIAEHKHVITLFYSYFAKLAKKMKSATELTDLYDEVTQIDEYLTPLMTNYGYIDSSVYN